MLRFHLPPNFPAAAARDAVPLRVEVDPSATPAPELFPALALLQRWSGAATPPKFIQLSRAQLRELATAAGTQPIFVENGRAAAWRHDDLIASSAPDPGRSTLDSRRPSPGVRPFPGVRDSASPGTGLSPLSPGICPSPLDPRPASPGHRTSSAAQSLIVDGSEHFLALTLPSREHPRYGDALALVKEQGFILEPSNRKWWLRDRHKALNFLAANWTRLRAVFDAEFTPNFEKNTAHLRVAEIVTTIAPAGDDYSVTLALQAGGADESTLRSAVATNRGYLESGEKVFLLDAGKLEKLTTAQRTLAGDRNATLVPRRTQRISAARAAEAEGIIEELSPGFQPPESWKNRSAALRNLTSLTPAPIISSLDQQLRPYQRLGTAWLWHLRRHQLGGILADEMGLGKTLQALGLLSAAHPGRLKIESLDLKEPDRRRAALNKTFNSQPSTFNSGGVSLVVCPASLLENWRRECLRFTPHLRVFVHHADNRLVGVSDFHPHDVVITSYGTLARDQTLFASVGFDVVIADEAQHIKNRRSQNAAALRALRAPARFLLTGTPLENSLDDLRSLFEFLLPGYLTKVPAGLRGDERTWYDERLRAQTAPYILRRTKQAVAPELPDKLEQVIWCELTAPQTKLYRETQESSGRELFDLEAGGASEAKLKFAALTQLLRLRQICCDPRLVAPESSADFSAKLDSFNELLAEAVDDGHRVLVFSQFTSLLALLRTELDAQQIAHCYLDGSMPTRARQSEVDRFQASPDVPLFLLSLTAGGTGLNLTGADTV
ncbi:MAG: SNF2-related protein, partial [Opitutaceae bacterium]